MPRRPIDAGIHVGRPDGEPSGPTLADELREAAAHWGSGVAVAAVRDGDRFEAITLTAFMVVSLAPPTILVSIGEHAAIVPLLDAAGRFGVSLLAADQRRIASMIADRVPTVRTFFPLAGDPLLEGALQGLACRTTGMQPAGDHRLYSAAVERVVPGRDAEPLLYYGRGFRRLAGN